MFGIDSGRLIGMYAVLLAGGVCYNLLTAWLEKHHYSDGFTSILVVIGVLFTIAPLALLSPEWAVLTALAFVASGTPMILGSVARYLQRRERERRRIAELLHGHEETRPAA